MSYTYKCAEFPGMEGCPASLTVATQEELWRHLELHGSLAHSEDPSAWSDDDRRQIQLIIERNSTSGSQRDEEAPM
ncbi:DUF1059 domain-containing protein [Nocardioides sp.]|nr:DUF1059 domain-containing protein [Nocardioides sp.]